jgi:Arm DNA-binding domain
MGVLTDSRVRAAKPKDKAYKLFDTQGLYLKVSTSGARLWRFKYCLHGREKLLSLGQYPDVPLGRAREKRDEARRLIADGIDPAVHRLVQKNAKADTFAVIAAEWLELQRKRFAPASLNELGWNPDLIELQLAHSERNEVHAAYNRAQRLPERRTMMQAWANHLDRLRADGTPQVASADCVVNADLIPDGSKTTAPSSENSSQLSVWHSFVLNRSQLYDLV